MKRCFYPGRVGIFSFVNIMKKILFPSCTLTWRVNNYFFRRRRSLDRRNENTFIMVLINFDFGTVEILFVVLHFVTVFDSETISRLKKRDILSLEKFLSIQK